MKLTLGFSPCPNDTFLFDALVNGRIDTGGLSFEIRLEDVETLNRRALRGELHLTKLSYFAYGQVSDHYVLMNAGSALGKGCGPLLIAREPMDPDVVNRAFIAIPGEHTTAHFLFGRAYPDAGNKVFVPFHEIEDGVLNGRFDAGVIIHENRFTYAARGLQRISDLGELWEQETGLPIPLGGIAARRDLPVEVLQQIDDLIRRSVRFGFDHPAASSEYVRCHAQEMEEEVQRQHIALYVNSFTENLGEDGREAVEYMLGAAEQTGLTRPLVRPLILDQPGQRTSGDG